MEKENCFDITLFENKTEYYPGDSVTGQCILYLKKDLQMHFLHISMHGAATVDWTERPPRSSNSETPAATAYYQDSDEHFSMRQVLFGQDTSADENNILTGGQHEFTFNFELPLEDIPISLKGTIGNIRYWLEAEIDKPHRCKLRSKNWKVEKDFTVNVTTDINKPEYLEPVEGNTEKTLYCCLCKSGSIIIKAQTDRRGYCPGESIAISAEFQNHSSRTVKPYTKLIQTQLFFARGSRKIQRAKYEVITGLPISPGSCSSWNTQLLTIPDVSPSIMNCRIIKLEYYIKVALRIPGTFNIAVLLPIVVGNVPFHPRVILPPYLENTTLPFSIEDPPRYSEFVNSAMDIKDEDIDQLHSMGDHKVTPMYTYEYNNRYKSPALEGGAWNLYDLEESHARVIFT